MRLQADLFDATLPARLEALGLDGVRRVELHENQSVMVSVTKTGALRIHRGYAYAPDSVLRDIVRYVRRGLHRQTRLGIERSILSFPVDTYFKRLKRGDRQNRFRHRGMRVKLSRAHAELNRRHFGGKLTSIAFRVSRRMRQRLGELLLGDENTPVEIAISYRHIVEDEWREVEHTLLHEMIHQWQAETGQPVDHGHQFRLKATSVGVAPRAMRHVRSRPQGAVSRRNDSHGD